MFALITLALAPASAADFALDGDGVRGYATFEDRTLEVALVDDFGPALALARCDDSLHCAGFASIDGELQAITIDYDPSGWLHLEGAIEASVAVEARSNPAADAFCWLFPEICDAYDDLNDALGG